jgi:hypothetical protein
MIYCSSLAQQQAPIISKMVAEYGVQEEKLSLEALLHVYDNRSAQIASSVLHLLDRRN